MPGGTQFVYSGELGTDLWALGSWWAGGVVFGAGMTRAGGCVTGMLRKAGADAAALGTAIAGVAVGEFADRGGRAAAGTQTVRPNGTPRRIVGRAAHAEGRGLRRASRASMVPGGLRVTVCDHLDQIAVVEAPAEIAG